MSYTEGDRRFDDKVVVYKEGGIFERPIRSVPCPNNWFENVWNDFNKRRNI